MAALSLSPHALPSSAHLLLSTLPASSRQDDASVHRRLPLPRGNSAPLPSLLVVLPFRAIPKPRLRTFLCYCKPHGAGLETQLVHLIHSSNGSALHHLSDATTGQHLQIAQPSLQEYFDPDTAASNRHEKLGVDGGCVCSNVRPGGLSVVDYVKRIIGLPMEERVQVLDLLQCDNQSLTISDYNDILEILLRAEQHEHVIRLFSELQPNGIAPDLRSFSVLAQCYCKKNDPFEAKRVLDEMLVKGFKPNVATFTSVIRSLCTRGRVTMAIDVLDKMRKVGVDPTIRIYNSLMVGLCYVGRLEDASDLMNNLKDSPTKPDIYTYNVVVDSYCKVGKVDEAVQFFAEAKNSGLQPTIVTYNALLNGLSKEGRTVEAISLLKEMQAQGKIPDLVSYNIVLRGLLTTREYSRAYKMFKRMREAGFEVGMRSSNAVLRGLCRLCISNKELLKDVKQLFQILTAELHFTLTPYTYCLMIQAIATAGEVDSALVHLNNMVSMGASPRILTFNILIRLLCREGRVYDAQSVFLTMFKFGTLPSVFSFEILINEFTSQGKILGALAVYATAIKLSIDPKWRLRDEFKCRKD